MKMPISEIIDRYTITKLKSERTSDNVIEELNFYKKELDEGIKGLSKVKTRYNR